MPILLERSYRLYPLAGGNYRILPDPDDPDAPAGLIVKQSFWLWPERDLAGNTIDFFVKVEGLSFHQAMQILAAHTDPVSSGIGREGQQQEKKQPVPIEAPARDMDDDGHATSESTDEDGNKTREERGNDEEITR